MHPGDAHGVPRGLAASFLSLWGSAGRHIQSIVELAGLEGREALALYLRLAVMLGAALVFGVFAYVLVLLFVAFLVSSIFGVAWLWILLALAVVHILVAAVCANHVRCHMRTAVFAATRSELKKDFDALNSLRPPQKNP
jgi:uncharacterized membrane protein YqjE